MPRYVTADGNCRINCISGHRPKLCSAGQAHGPKITHGLVVQPIGAVALVVTALATAPMTPRSPGTPGRSHRGLSYPGSGCGRSCYGRAFPAGGPGPSLPDRRMARRAALRRPSGQIMARRRALLLLERASGAKLNALPTGTPKLAIQAISHSVFDQNRNVVPHPARIQRSVLLLDDVLDVFPWHGWILFSKPVHDLVQRALFFIDSHSPIVGYGGCIFKTGILLARCALPRKWHPRRRPAHSSCGYRRATFTRHSAYMTTKDAFSAPNIDKTGVLSTTALSCGDLIEAAYKGTVVHGARSPTSPQPRTVLDHRLPQRKPTTPGRHRIRNYPSLKSGT